MKKIGLQKEQEIEKKSGKKNKKIDKFRGKIKIDKNIKHFIPLIFLLSILLVLVLSIVETSYLSYTNQDMITKNYQTLGVLDDNTFAFKYSYKIDNTGYIVPYKKVEIEDDYSFEIKNQVYYQMYFQKDNKYSDVISEGFLTNDTISFDMNSMKGYENVIIQVYSIKDKSELQTSKPLETIIIDKRFFVDKIDVFKKLNPTTKNSDDEIKTLMTYIDYNYLNDRTMSYLPNDFEKYFTTNKYLKMDYKEQYEFLTSSIVKLYDYLMVQKNLILDSGVTEDDIKGFLSIKEPYANYFVIDEYIKNYNLLVDYSFDKMKETVETLELEKRLDGYDLTEYYEIRDSMSIYEQKDYLSAIK